MFRKLLILNQRIPILFGLVIFAIIFSIHYLPTVYADPMQNVSNSTNDKLSFVGYSNATDVLLSMPDPVLSNEDKQQMIDEVMNLPGIKAWSNNWKFLGMGFIGTTSPTFSWQYAVIRLQLLPSDDAAFYCEYGWGAVAKVDLTTKQIAYAQYPTKDDHLCNIITAGPIHNNVEKHLFSWTTHNAYADSSLPSFQSFATAEQYDVNNISNHFYGNQAYLVPPYYSQSIFTDMNSNRQIEQLLNADWNQQCQNGLQTTPDCFTQAGWVVLNYDCGSSCNYLTHYTEDLVYVDQSTTGSYVIQNTLLSVTSGHTETVKIACNTSTSYQRITILYTTQEFDWNTKIPCSVYQTSDTFNNSVFFENWNDEPSANWANDVLSTISATNASEFNSQGTAFSWASTLNADGHASLGVIDTGSLVLTGNLAGAATAKWSNLSFMPTYANACNVSPSGWTVSTTCILGSSNTVTGDVVVPNGKVLIIPSGVTLTIPFTNNKLSIGQGGTVLLEPAGTIS